MSYASQRHKREQDGLDSAGDIHHPGWNIYPVGDFGNLQITIRDAFNDAAKAGTVSVALQMDALPTDNIGYPFVAGESAVDIATAFALAIAGDANYGAIAVDNVITITPIGTLNSLKTFIG